MGNHIPNELISLIQFSKLIGKTKQAVSKMISEGRLTSRSYMKDSKGYHIDARLAMEDLKMNTDLAHRNSTFQEESPSKAVASKPRREVLEVKPEESASLIAMKRNKMAIEIKKSMLELQVLQGKLVEKDKVFDVLYEFGQTIRQNFQVIPNKIVDDVMAAQTRNEAHKIITDAIDGALMDLVRTGELNFTKK